MEEPDVRTSPLESVAETTGERAAKAFALLGNETRLAILLVLWEAYEPLGDETLSFSQLFGRVDYDDRGNFNYHIGELEGQFIRKHPDKGGYELTDPGLKLVQTVIAGVEAANETFEPSEIDQLCLFCGALTAVAYRDRHVFWECTECSGIVPEESDMHGFLGAVKLEPAGVTDRTPEKVRAASQVAHLHREASMFDGLCPTCSGPVDSRLDPCTDHDLDGICENCNRRFPARAYFECRVCKDHVSTSVGELAIMHPRVIAFVENHGMSTRITADDIESSRRLDAFRSSQVREDAIEVVSDDPPRAAVMVRMDGDEIRLTFDEGVSVIDVKERAQSEL